jgi:hypothetical protein
MHAIWTHVVVSEWVVMEVVGVPQSGDTPTPQPPQELAISLAGETKRGKAGSWRILVHTEAYL